MLLSLRYDHSRHHKKPSQVTARLGRFWKLDGTRPKLNIYKNIANCICSREGLGCPRCKKSKWTTNLEVAKIDL